MEDWKKEFEEYLEKAGRSFKPGEVVEGILVQISQDHAFVDIGGKQEALLPVSEIKKEDGSFYLNPGDRVEALVVRRLPAGSYLLSVSKLLEQKLWKELKKAFESGSPIVVKVKSGVKGGYRVVYEEKIIGFLPFSQAYFKRKPSSKELVGKNLEVKILLLEEGKNFVVSRRVILEEEFKQKKEALYQVLREGGVVEGEVKSKVDGGFLVDLDGLLLAFLPFKELSWQRIKNPEEYLKPGDKVRAKVLFFDEVKAKARISIKALEPDPWESLPEKYKEGDRVKGKVVGIFNFGAFVEIEPGVEGLIPASEVSWRKKAKVSEIFEEGDLVEAVIITLDPEKRRLTLSLKRLEPSPWEKVTAKLKPGDVVEGKVSSIKDFGLFVEVEEGVEGFVHISNVSWKRVENLREIFKRGDRVKACVLEIDPEKKRLALSIKHLKPDPLKEFVSAHKEGDEIEVKVKKQVEKGFIVEINPELEAFLPFTEVWENPIKPSFELKPGDSIKAVLDKIDPEKRSILVSYLKYKKRQEEKELEEYKKGITARSGFTLGEVLLQSLKGGAK